MKIICTIMGFLMGFIAAYLWIVPYSNTEATENTTEETVKESIETYNNKQANTKSIGYLQDAESRYTEIGGYTTLSDPEYGYDVATLYSDVESGLIIWDGEEQEEKYQALGNVYLEESNASWEQIMIQMASTYGETVYVWLNGLDFKFTKVYSTEKEGPKNTMEAKTYAVTLTIGAASGADQYYSYVNSSISISQDVTLTKTENYGWRFYIDNYDEDKLEEITELIKTEGWGYCRVSIDYGELRNKTTTITDQTTANTTQEIYYWEGTEENYISDIAYIYMVTNFTGGLEFGEYTDTNFGIAISATYISGYYVEGIFGYIGSQETASESTALLLPYVDNQLVQTQVEFSENTSPGIFYQGLTKGKIILGSTEELEPDWNGGDTYYTLTEENTELLTSITKTYTNVESYTLDTSTILTAATEALDGFTVLGIGIGTIATSVLAIAFIYFLIKIFAHK